VGLTKNTAQITTLFALGNLWMMRKSPRKAQNTPQVELAATLSMRVAKCGPIASVIENRAE
jgi:hypothetical protein